MEVLSGFVLVVGFDVLQFTAVGYNAFWIALAVGMAGAIAAMNISTGRLVGRRGKLAALGAGAVVVCWKLAGGA